MAEISFSMLSAKDKQTLLAEVSSGIAAATIIKQERGSSSIKDLDLNYVSYLSGYLASTLHNYIDLDDAIKRLGGLGAKLSDDLDYYFIGTEKTADDTLRAMQQSTDY